jgi:cytochrome c oxidase subunit 2
MAWLPAVVVLAGCHVPGFATLHPADRQGQEASRLWGPTQFTALGVGVVVWALIAYTLVRYRQSGKTSSQRAVNVPLEITYTVIPLAIVAVLFTATTIAQRRMVAISAHPDVTVGVTAFQWGWQFTYPDGKTVTSGDTGPPVLVLPLDRTIEIDLTATDVVHAFYVPAFLFQRNAVPGAPTKFDVTPTRLGDFDGHCSTFCGIRHYQMSFTVRVVAPADFDRWVTGG